MGAEMYSHGLASREPLKLGGTAATLQCGAMAAVAAMGALTAYEVHGTGQLVDVPCFTVQISNIDRRSSSILAYRFSGRVQDRPASHISGLAGGIYPVADGYVEIAALPGTYWRRFVEMIGDETLKDPSWDSPLAALQPGARETVDGIVYPWMLERTRAEVWEAARQHHVMGAPLYTGLDLWNDRAFHERGLWTTVTHPDLGELPMLGRPYIFEKTPWRIRSAAPRLGEHTHAILEAAGLEPAVIQRLTAEGVIA